MKKFKGTKGEWIIQSDLSVLIGHECEYLWSYTGKISNFKHELLANAKLIAAAPELLEACQQAIRIVDLWAPSYNEKQIKESDIGELAALSMMRMALEKAIEKALN